MGSGVALTCEAFASCALRAVQAVGVVDREASFEVDVACGLSVVTLLSSRSGVHDISTGVAARAGAEEEGGSDERMIGHGASGCPASCGERC